MIALNDDRRINRLILSDSTFIKRKSMAALNRSLRKYLTLVVLKLSKYVVLLNKLKKATLLIRIYYTHSIIALNDR